MAHSVCVHYFSKTDNSRKISRRILDLFFATTLKCSTENHDFNGACTIENRFGFYEVSAENGELVIKVDV